MILNANLSNKNLHNKIKLKPQKTVSDVSKPILCELGWKCPI